MLGFVTVADLKCHQCFRLRQKIFLRRQNRDIIIKPQIIGAFERAECKSLTLGLHTDNLCAALDQRVNKFLKTSLSNFLIMVLI